MKYEHKVYGTGYTLKVTPEDRGVDVLHFLITGHLLGGRSLDDVTWEEIDDNTLTKGLVKSLSESLP